jgi:hypothetical protein
MRVCVTTVIDQCLEVPEGTSKQDVLNFLAAYQSFRDAFQGLSNEDQTIRIVDLDVVSDDIIQLGEEAYDD